MLCHNMCEHQVHKLIGSNSFEHLMVSLSKFFRLGLNDIISVWVLNEQMPEKGVAPSFQFCTHKRGFQNDFIFIFAPKSCERPQCIFIFWGKSLFSHVYWQEVKEMTL